VEPCTQLLQSRSCGFEASEGAQKLAMAGRLIRDTW